MTKFIDELNVNFEEIENFERRLRRYSLESKLELCRKMSHVIDPYRMNVSKIETSLFDDFNYTWLKKYLKVAPIFEVEYLALSSIVAGEWNGSVNKIDRINDYVRIMKHLRNYCPPFAHIKDLPEIASFDEESDQINTVIDTFMSRMAFQQLKGQKLYTEDLYRYKSLFELSTNDMDMNNIFIENFKYRYDDYVKFITVLFVLSLRSYDKLTFCIVKENIQKCANFEEDKIEYMIQMLATSRTQVIDEYNTWKSEDQRLTIYNYNPLIKKPIVIEEENIYLPCPHFLFKAITEGFYHELCDVNKKNNFRSDFGKHIFEEYVYEVLKWEDKYQIVPEFKYKIRGSEAKSPDFILINGNDMILIEIKSSTPSIKLRSSDLKTYEEQLIKGFGVGFTQCLKKEKQIRDNVLFHEDFPEVIDNIYFLVITLEEFFIAETPNMKQIIHEICKDNNIEFPEDKKFHFMGIETLEAIIEQDKRSLFQFIKDREATYKAWNGYVSNDVEHDLPRLQTRASKVWLSNVIEIMKVLSDRESHLTVD